MFASWIFTVSSLTFVVIGAEYIASSPVEPNANYCVLPPYPEHGRYTVSNNLSATPGERYSSVRLDISCDTGYLNNNTVKRILCLNGDWSASMPKCDRDSLGFCTLPTGDLKVEYRCLSFPGTLERSWECESLVPMGTAVRPICRFPAYFSFKLLPEMHCRDGMWDYNPICQPVAQCFCDYNDNNKLFPASNYMVAVNKMYRPYNYSRDMNVQYSHVFDIKIPPGYRGYAKSFEDDIAIVVIETPLFFHLSVHPVCLDFDNNLDRNQLTDGSSGKAVRWTISGNSDESSEVKNVVDFEYINIEDCSNKFRIKDRQYLSNDKFCAGYNSAERSSTQDVGGGLAFLEPTTQRYYLLGVLSIGYIGGSYNNIVYIHTSIVKHEHFIKEHL